MIYIEMEKDNKDIINLLDCVSGIDNLVAKLRQAIYNKESKNRIDALAGEIEKQAVKLKTEVWK